MFRRKASTFLAALLLLSMVLTGCTGGTPSAGPAASSAAPDSSSAAARKVLAQGITDDAIYIGSTMSTSGSYALIGVPAMDALRGVFNRVNANGGIGGRNIELVYYDDSADAAGARALIERLTEEDKVFALNCLAYYMVSSALDYIDDYGIPLVYVASGMNVIYSDDNPEGNIFPVQPNFGQDGGFVAARLFHESIFGANQDEKMPADANIGVMYGNNDTGNDLISGFMAQATLEGRNQHIIAEGVTADTYASAIQKFKDNNCQAVVILLADSRNVIARMDDVQYEVPVICYYGTSSNTAWSAELYKETRPSYSTGWADYSTEEAQILMEDFYDAIEYCGANAETKTAYRDNAYAVVGYIAGELMVDGLQRLEDSGLDYSWENFIACMEAEPFSLITGSILDYANGQRLGSLQECMIEFYATANDSGELVMTSSTLRPFETIEEIMAK